MIARIICGTIGFLVPLVILIIGVGNDFVKRQEVDENIAFIIWDRMGFGFIELPVAQMGEAALAMSLLWAAIGVAICMWFQRRRARPQIWDKFIFGLCGFILPNLFLTAGYGLEGWKHDSLQHSLLKLWQVMGFGLVGFPHGDNGGAVLFVSCIWAAIGVAACTLFQMRKARSHGYG